MVELKLCDPVDGIRRFVEAPLSETSRVWLCTVCGAKVFFCRVVPAPHYRCLCGGKQWKPGSQMHR